MLHDHKFEPAVGCTAMLEGVVVKVHQRIDADTFLVLGDRITRRARASELSAPPEPSLFDRWIGERTYPGSDQLVTPERTLFADFADWLKRQGAPWPTNPERFAWQMYEAGHHRFLASWCEPGDTQHRTRRVYALLLKGAGV